MALDGMFLNCLKEEIAQVAVGTRVDKVYQPSREEIVLNLRSRNGSFRLLMSARANSPRVHFTQYTPENPQKPPMLCMLLRKHLIGAVLTGIRQVELDRILFFDFDATNEIGDRVKLSLCIEIMAQYSNIILIDGDGKIVDSLKRVDFTKSSVRLVLPSLEYQFPPQQGKLNILTTDLNVVVETILTHITKNLSSAILSSIMGVSPIVCREISHSCCGNDLPISQLDDTAKTELECQIKALKQTLSAKSYKPTIIYDETKKPMDFSFFNISQYGTYASVNELNSFSELLDTFYYEKDKIERISKRSQDLRKNLSNTYERTAKKLDLQRAELEQCSDREMLRIYAELITAHQYNLKKGSFFYDLPNYYDNDKILRVPADPTLTPLQNSQKYYKEYKKSYTAEKMLKELIQGGMEELLYIESVLDTLTRADSERELAEIRDELSQTGYIRLKKQGKAKKQPAPLPPLCFFSSDGFKILVGRNNIQNDKLSLKTAAKSDTWLHTKDFPGAHIIVVSDGKVISETAIHEAAIIAGVFSKASNSSQVPVDYTLVKNLKKPNGAKPGKVIYTVYNTLYVTPDTELVEKLKAQN
ncbi:MAG: NFACT RNA binding domain-containing protein [Oscillospiraceae bacterium]